MHSAHATCHCRKPQASARAAGRRQQHGAMRASLEDRPKMLLTLCQKARHL
jgi:hypothetical protein